MTAISWGFAIEQTAAQLLVESASAREPRRGKTYAELTARNAAEAVETTAAIAETWAGLISPTFLGK